MRKLLLFLAILLLMLPGARAQETTVRSDAQRYHEMLRRRPQSGAVFDRFYAAWLESGTADTLRKYLVERTEAAGATSADHLVLALFHARQGDDKAALGSYANALVLEPGNATAWVEKARLEARLHDFTNALGSLSKAAAAGPDATLAMDIEKTRIRLLLRSGQTDAAMKKLRELVAAHPADDDVMEDVVALQTDEGLLEEAASNLKTLLARTKDVHQAITRRLQLADLALRQSQRDAAIALYLEALDRTGQDTWVEAEILARLETAYRREDDLDGLFKKLGELSAAQPQRIALAVARARAAAELGNGTMAIQQFHEILARTPGRRDLREQFLDVLEAMDKTAEAVTQVQSLVSQNPEDRELRLRLATLQHKGGNDAAAESSLEAALAVRGTSEGDHLRVARLLEQWALKDAARAAYVRMVSLYPDSAGAKEAQAHFLHRGGERDAALTIWRSLAKSGSLEDVIRVGQALVARGEVREAKELLLARVAEFSSHARYLTLVVQSALADKDAATALPHARSRLKLALAGHEIDDALRLTRSAIAEGKQEDAVIAELGPQNVLTVQERCLLAWLLEGKGRAAEAENLLEGAPPKDATIALTQLAQLWQARQQWTKAANVVSKLFSMPDGRTSAHAQKLVDLHRRAGEIDKALSFVPEWKRLSPGAVQPWLDEARLITDAGRGAQALDVLRAAVRKFTDSMELATALADGCIAAGKAEEAERIYLDLYEKTQDNTTRSRLLGPLTYAAQARGALPQLIERFTERQRLNRASPLPWLALAEIQRVSGNDEERRRCLYEASRLRPKDLDLLTEIARSESECGLWKQALRTLEAAAQLDKTTKTRERIAKLHLEQGDEDTGYRLLYELAGGDAMDVRSLEQLADAICENRDWERAVTFLEPLLPKHPKDYRLHYLHAVALEESGRDAEALAAFVRLLDFNEELAGVTNTGMPWQVQGRGNVDLKLPPGAKEWMLLPQLSQWAYQHRTKQPGARGGYMHGMGGSTPQTQGIILPGGFVTQPQNVSVLSPFALSHVLTLADGLGREQSNTLAAKLTRAGIKDAGLLLAFGPGKPRGLIPEELLDQYSGHQALHAAWLMTSAGYQGGPEFALLTRIFEMFRADYPALATSAAVRAWQSDAEKGLPLVRLALADLAKLDAAEPLIAGNLMGLLNHLRPGSSDDGQPRLPEEMKLQVVELLRRWISAAGATRPGGYAWLPQQLIHVLIAQGMWQDVLEMLEDEIALAKKNPSSAAGPFASAGLVVRGGYRSSVALMPLPFPADVVGLPQSMAFLLADRNPYAGYTEVFPGMSDEGQKAMLEKLEPLIPRVNDPALRFVLQALAKQEAQLDAEVQRRTASPSATAGDWKLAAWVAQRRGELKVAIDALTKAASLEQDAVKRAPIDFAILFHAQQVQQGAPLSADPKAAETDGGDAIRTPVKEAFARLARTGLQPSEKAQVVEMMQMFGLEEEAMALQQTAAARGPTANPAAAMPLNPYSQRFSSSSSGSGINKVERLVKAGNKQAAVQEAVKHLRQWSAQWLTGQGQGLYEYQQAHTLLQKLGLADAVREAAKPPPEAGWKQLQEYAALMELSKDTVAARTFYEAALERNPRAFQARQRLVSLLADTDVNSAVAHFEALSGKRTMPIQQADWALWQELAPRDKQPFAHRLAMARVLTTSLNRMADADKPLDPGLFSLIPTALQYVQQGQSDGSFRFASLWQPVVTDDPADPFAVPVRWQDHGRPETPHNSVVTQARQQLRTAHDELCRALLRFPETAYQGFAPLAGLVMAEKGDLSEMSRIAQNLLTQQADPKFKRRSSVTTRSRSYARQDHIPLPHPVDVLVRHAALTGGMPAVERDVLPLVRAVDRKGEQTLAAAYARLLTCPEPEFIDAARAWALLPSATNPMWIGSNRLGHGGPMQEVINIWNERRLTVPLDPLMIGSIIQDRRMAAPYMSAYVPEVWILYAAALSRRGDADATLRFVRTVRDEFLGADPEVRRKNVEAWRTSQFSQRRRSRYGYQFGFPQGQGNSTAKIAAWSQWLQTWMSGPDVNFALAVAGEDGFLDVPEWLQQAASSMGGGNLLRDPKAVVRLADTLGFLAPPETFRTWDLSVGGERGTWMEMFAERIGNDPGNKQAAQEEIAKRPPTLGTELFVALLNRNSKDAFAAAVKRRAADFARVPEPRRAEVAVLLRRHLPGYPDRGMLDENLAKALAPIIEDERRLHQQKLEVMLNAKTWAEVGMEEQVFVQTAPTMIGAVASADKKKAVFMINRALELLRNSPAEKQAAIQGGSRSLSSMFAAQLGAYPELLGEMFEIAEAQGFTEQRRWAYEFASRVVQGARDGQDIGRAARLLTGTPLVADLEHFKDLRLPGNSEGTLLGMLVGPFRYSNAPAGSLDAVRDALLAQPRTFGVELAAALLNLEGAEMKLPPRDVYRQRPAGEIFAPAMAAFIKQHAADFAKLDDARAATMLALLRFTSEAMQRHAPLPDDLASCLKPLMEAAAREEDAEAARWLTTTSLKTLYPQPYDALEPGLQLLREIARRDPAAARTLFEHQCQLFSSADRVQRSGQRPAETQLARFVQSASRAPEVFGAAMAKGEQMGLTKEKQWLAHFLQGAVYAANESSDPNRIMALLEGANLLGDASRFRLYAIPVERGEESDPGSSKNPLVANTLLSMLQPQILSRPGMRDRIISLLDARQPQTFGVKLTRALLSDNSDAQLLTFVREHQEDLNAMSDDTRADLAAALANKVSDLNALAAAAPSMETALQPLRTARFERLAKYSQQWLGANSLATVDRTAANELQMLWDRGDFPGAFHGGDSRALAGLLAKVAAVVAGDPVKGAQVYDHLFKLARQAGTGTRRSGPMQTTTVAIWLAESCSQPDLLPLAVRHAAEEKLGDDPRWRSRMMSAMLQAPGGAGPAARCQHLLETLGFLADPPAFDAKSLPGGGADATVFGLLMSAAAQMIPQADREKLAENLRARAPRTFGGDLAVVALRQGTDAALLEFGEAHREDLAKLSDVGKAQVLAVCRGARTPVNPMRTMPMPTAYRVASGVTSQFSTEVAAALAPLMEIEKRFESDAIAAVKEGRKPDLTQMTHEAFKTVCCDELLQLFKRSPAEALTFYKQVATAWEDSFVPAQTNGFPGESLRTELLIRVLRRDENLASLALVMRCCVEDGTGRAEFPIFPSNIIWLTAWRQAGGYARPDTAWNKIMNEFAASLGDTPPVLIPLVAYEQPDLKNQGPPRGLLKWAQKCQPGEPAYPIAEACRMAHLLQQHAHTIERNAIGFYFRRRPPPELDPAWRYFTKSVQDESLPEMVRLQIAYQICTKLPCYAPDEIYRIGTRLAIASHRAGNGGRATNVEAFLRGFATLKVDQEWNEIANAYWGARDLKQIPSYVSDAGAMMSLQAGDKTRLRTLMSGRGGSFVTRRGAFILMVQKGLAREAAEELRTNWQNILFTWRSSAGPIVGPTPREQIDAVAASFPDPAFGLLAEFILTEATAELRDSETDVFRPIFRHGKLGDLASRVAALNSGDPLLIAALTAMVVKADPSTATRLSAQLARGAALARRPAADRNTPPPLRGLRENVMAAYVAERWQAGDFTAVREAVSPDEDYAGDFARDLFGNLLGTLLCEMLEHGSLKDSAAAREVLQAMARGTQRTAPVVTLGSFLMVLELWDDSHGALSEPAFAAFKSAMSSNSNLRDAYRYNGPMPFDWLVALAATDKSPEGSRRKLAAALRVLRERAKLRQSYYTSAQDFVRMGLFSAEEVCDHSQEFAEAMSGDGSLGTTMATLAAGLGRPRDELAMLRLSAASGSPTSSAVLGRKLHLAGVLIREGMHEEARTILKDLEAAKMSEGQRREWESLMKIGER